MIKISSASGLNKGFYQKQKMEPMKLPIEDVLDLHTFHPNDIPNLLEDYFAECIKAGIFGVRIIHGKGKGIQKRRVQKLLKENPSVVRNFLMVVTKESG